LPIAAARHCKFASYRGAINAEVAVQVVNNGAGLAEMSDAQRMDCGPQTDPGATTMSRVVTITVTIRAAARQRIAVSTWLVPSACLRAFALQARSSLRAVCG
jgi:hypothetical protein